MTDHSELKRLAEAALRNWPDSKLIEHSECERFIDAASPAAVLALIAEIERLSIREDVLENLCDARFRINLDIETERDKLKAEVARSTEREIMQLAEIEALRKDAERYRWLRNPSDGVVVRDRLSHLIGDHMDSRIHSAMSKGDKP